MFKQMERAEILQSVRDVNRVVLRVAKVADGVLSRELDAWPCVKIGEREVNPSIRLGEDFFQSCVLPWSFGQEGEEEHRLKSQQSITTNSKGQFIVADNSAIKVFDCSGKFMLSLSCGFEDIRDVATDREDNVYAMTSSSKIIVFDKEGRWKRSFGVRRTGCTGISVTVTGNRRVFVLMANLQNREAKYRVDVQEADAGELVDNFPVKHFGRGPTCIISGSEDRVMVWSFEGNNGLFNSNRIQVFNTEGHLLKSDTWRDSSLLPVRVMAFHLSTEHILIPLRNYGGTLNIDIRTKDGKPMRNLQMETEKIGSISGITETKDGRIAVLCTIQNTQKHLVLVE